jgi:hypothetical protein
MFVLVAKGAISKVTIISFVERKMITKKELDFWIENKLNVLMKGKHGVGKTTMIIEAFEEAGLKWKYFSAATMDPWVDFIGIPKEKTEGDKTYLELIRPKAFAEDEVEALFFDEYNRAPKKVRNSVMELIQFKSINGKPFKNLKMVWAAINPDDDDEETYDVDMLDPAQLDRFQVHVEVPYKPNYYFFSGKYGSETASKAIEWWNSQSELAKSAVSPRRLDYAIEMFNAQGKVEHVIPPVGNVSQFKKLMEEVALEAEYKKLASLTSDEDKRNLLGDESFYERIYPYLQEKGEELNWLGFLPKEKIGTIVADDLAKVQHLLKNEHEVAPFKEVLDGIVESALSPLNVEFIEKARNSSLETALEEIMGDVIWQVQIDKHWPQKFKYGPLNVNGDRNTGPFQVSWVFSDIIEYEQELETDKVAMKNNALQYNPYRYRDWSVPKSQHNSAIHMPDVSTTYHRKACLADVQNKFSTWWHNDRKYNGKLGHINFYKTSLHSIAGFINGSQTGTILKRIKKMNYIPFIFNYSMDKILEQEPEYFRKDLDRDYKKEMIILFNTLRDKPALKKTLKELGFCFL